MSSESEKLLRTAERSPGRVEPRAVVRSASDGTITLNEAAEVLVCLAETAEENPLGDLEPLLTAGDHGLRNAAVSVVIEIGTQSLEPVEPLVPGLVTAFEDGDRHPSTQLLRALSVVAPVYPAAFRSSVEQLLSTLTATGRDGREAVVSVLYWISEDEPGRLTEHADALQDHLRYLAAVEETNDRAAQQPTANDPAVREIESEQFFNDRVRVIAIQTLANVASACDDPADVIDIELLTGFTGHKQHPGVRTESIAVLGVVAKDAPDVVRDRIPRLSGYTTADDERTAGKAAWTLGILAAAYPDEVAREMESRVDSVVSLLDAESATTRGEALTLLTYLAGNAGLQEQVREATPALVSLLDDDRSFVRGGAVLTLRTLGGERALDELRQVSETDPDPDVRETATETVRKLSPEE